MWKGGGNTGDTTVVRMRRTRIRTRTGVGWTHRAAVGGGEVEGGADR